MKRFDVFVPVLGSIVIIALISIPFVTGSVKDYQSYLVGLAAVVTSWISLYFSIIRQALRKPAIRLETNAGTITLDPKEGQKTYLRLKVTNFGQSIAKNCVGRLLEVYDEDNKNIQYDPLYFFWARQNDEDVGFHPVNIYPGDAHFLDVIRIGHKDQNFKFRVSTLGQPLPSGKYLPMKSYIVKIAVYADDMEPFQAWYQIKLNKGSLKDSYLERVKETNLRLKK